MKRKLEEKTPKEQRAIKLIKSITTGDVAEAKQLISEMSNKEIDAVDEFGNTALHIAAEEGMQEVCKMLIPKMSHGAINAVTTDLFSSNTALHIAAEEGMQEVCKMLIPEMSKKAINAADNYGRTALHIATEEGMQEVCKMLIPEMSEEAINAVTTEGKTALHIAAGERHKEVCELLIPKMSKKAINAVTTDLFSSKTALHYAAENGMQEVCKLLIPKMSKKAINAVTTDLTTDLFSSKTALHYAVNNGIFSSKTALHYAAEKGMQEVCKMLIPEMSKEAINSVDKFGNTILHYATEEGMQEVYEMLISKMSDEAINAVDKNGKTALDYATERSSKKIVDTKKRLEETEELLCAFVENLQSSKKMVNTLPPKFKPNLQSSTENGKTEANAPIPKRVPEKILKSTPSKDTEWYDYLSIKYGLIKKGIQDGNILTPAQNEEELKSVLNQITEPNYTYLIPLNVNAVDRTFTATNHWVGLYVITDAATKIGSIKYINPIGQPINRQLALKIQDLTGSKTDDLTVGKVVQFAYTKEYGIRELRGNSDDCGPMLVQLFHELAEYGKIRTRSLNEKESIEFGQKCREEQRLDKDTASGNDQSTILSKTLSYKEEEIYVAEVVRVADKKTLSLKEAEDYIPKCISEGSVRIEGTNLLIEKEENKATIKWRNITGGQNTMEENVILVKLAEVASLSMIYMDVSNTQHGTQKSSILSSEWEDVGPQKVYNLEGSDENREEVDMTGHISQGAVNSDPESLS